MRSEYRLCVHSGERRRKSGCLLTADQALVEHALNSPVAECFVARAQWKRMGLATVMVSRMVAPNQYTFSLYMIDTLCLGLKDTFVVWNASEHDYLTACRALKEKFGLNSFDYEDCRSLILGAIDYAANLGLEPHYDWVETSCLVEADRRYKPKFEFGENGIPVYIPGPRDNAAKVLRQLRKVEHIYKTELKPKMRVIGS
ncbi:MAG: hypothetical protein K2Z81_22550 [Cyanobacteria bacterium]|nr:hypothetical protein [Cyanobacteriota bacterium]